MNLAALVRSCVRPLRGQSRPCLAPDCVAFGIYVSSSHYAPPMLRSGPSHVSLGAMATFLKRLSVATCLHVCVAA